MIVLTFILMTGCSHKTSTVKVGAMGGGVTGALIGGLLGAAASSGHTGNDNTTKSVLLGALVVGSLGALLGAGTGYLFADSNNTDKEIQEMVNTEKMMKKL